MSNEYIFFDDALCQRFVRFLEGKGIASRPRTDAIAGSVVELPDELADDVLEVIDAEYDLLMDEQMTLSDSKEGWVTHQAVGISATLSDGQIRQIRLPPEIARRLLEHFTAEEVHGLVSAIARSLGNPLDGPLCRKPE